MITDAKLFEQIEVAFAAGDTVYRCVEKRLGRKVAPADFNLEQTLAFAKVWQPSQRLKERLGRWL